MAENDFPENLGRLHDHEELLRAQAVTVVSENSRLLLHLAVAEQAMDLLDVFRQISTDDEDLKVVQILGLRIFNAIASAIKLMLSGYSQTSTMLLRDILETVFLVGLFRTDRLAIRDGFVAVRHSKEKGEPTIFTAEEWRYFVMGVKAGEFDLG